MHPQARKAMSFLDGSPDDPAPQASAASSLAPTDVEMPAEAKRRKTQLKQEPADPPQDAEMPGEVVEIRNATPDADASDARSISVQQAMYRQYLEKLLQAKAECMFPGFVRSGMADVLSKLFPEGQKEVSLASARAALFTVEEIFKVAAQSALNTVEEKLLASSSTPQKVVQVRSASPEIKPAETGAEAKRRRKQLKQEPAHPPQDVEMPGEVVEIPSATPGVAAPQTCVPKPEPGCTMMLKRQYGDAIFDGRKLWEGRPKDSRGGKKIQLQKYMKFRMGSQSQEYPYLLAQVTEIREFADAKEMLSTLGVAALLPDGPETLDEAVAVYHGFGDAYKGPMVAYKLVDPWRFLSADAAPQASAVRSSAQEVEMSTDAIVPAQVVETRSAATGTKRSGKQTPATEQDSAAEQDPSATTGDAKRARKELPALSEVGSQKQGALLTKDAMLNYVRGLGLLRWRSQLKKHLLSLHIPRGAASESETPFKWAAEFGVKMKTDGQRNNSSRPNS